ncbi:hypothetical protein B0A53_06068 [Rhodotorula sp. CCFEE 5036]|nr:hypothetical protein B0A53_06068 [Rhodotorula sp. CCFEE 5036]
MSDLVDLEDSNAGEPGSGLRRRRVQLGDLPHQIKDLIVQHCHGADHDIDCTIQSLVKRGGLPAGADCSLDDLRKAYRRTVAVLFEVSKDWQALCAPYRFENLSPAKVADDFFHLVIAPKYGHHFHNVDFTATTSTQIVEFAKALPLLPNLHTIKLPKDLLDVIHVLDTPLQQAVEAKLILTIANCVRHLTLRTLPLDDVLRFTAGARNVTQLSLNISDPLVLDGLWNIVAPMTHLFGSVNLDGQSDLVAIFASTLRDLNLGLQLYLPDALLQKTLDAVPGPPQLPKWCHLWTTQERTPLSPMCVAKIEKLVAEHTGLEYVDLCPIYKRLSLIDSSGQEDNHQSRRQLLEDSLSGEYPLLAMTDSDALAELLQHDTASEQRQNTLDAIDDVLEYATERRKRIAATEDWVDAARFVKDLGRLDLERIINLTRPRVQLNDLPAELKSKIAQQCHAADVRLEDALYALSKEWKKICAPYRFEVITTPQAGKAFFLLVIAPTYGQHFIKADLENFDFEGIVEFVKALPMLPNLRSFKLDGITLHMLETECDAQVMEIVMARLSSAIRQSARQLVLVESSLRQVLHFVWSAPLLSKLEVHPPSYDRQVITSLWRILTTTPAVTHLHMNLSEFDDDEDLLDLRILVDTRPASIAPLSTITLEYAELVASISDLLALFSPNLRTVTIKYCCLAEQPAAQPSALPTCALPNLQSLNLTGPADCLLPTLDGVTSALLPRLRMLTIDCRPADSTLSSASSAIVDRVKAIATEHSNLEVVKLSHPYARLDSRSGQAGDSAPSRHGTEMLNLPSVYPLLTTAKPDDSIQPYSNDDATGYSVKLLEAGMDWCKRASLTDDRVSLARLARALQPLDFERMLHEM